MRETIALLFGSNDYAFEIEKNIASEYEHIHIFRLGTDGEDSFDLGEDWDHLSEKFDMDACTVFCILEDTAENIFLTISLRNTFSNLSIIALSKDMESTDKLMLAGATRVLPSVEITANVIVEMLEKPIVTEVFHNILYEKSDLKIAQISIKDDSIFLKEHEGGIYPVDIDWSREYGVIVISVEHKDMRREFIYSSKAKHHMLKSGDVLVVVGYDEDIKKFENQIGRKSEK